MSHDDWCPRASYYRIRDVRDGKPYKQEQHGVSLLQIFDEGHAQHAKYQGYLREMGVLKGRWDCVECERKGVAWPDDPGKCPRCGSRSGVVYGEVPLDALKSTLIAGHADGWVARKFMEIKTIGLGTVRMDAPALLRKHTHLTVDGKQLPDMTGLWQDITRPFRPHIKQANIYLWIAALLGIDVDEMEFIYEFKANQQVRHFTIKLSPSVINPLLEKAETVKNGLATGNPPPREFAKKDKNPCKNCTWLTECWGEEDTEEPEPEVGRRRGTRSAESSNPADRSVRTRGTRAGSEQDPERPDRNRRRRANEPLRRDERMGGVSRDEVRERSGRRKIRRISSGDS
jgi:hypothetical protein